MSSLRLDPAARIVKINCCPPFGHALIDLGGRKVHFQAAFGPRHRKCGILDFEAGKKHAPGRDLQFEIG
jgi:hypothetical protein